MACAAPIVVTHPESKLRSEVRCGQCRSCRLRRKLAWVGRLILESREHQASRFITLTYAKDPGVLRYSDYQLFMKRYREEKGHVRFFCVGEYGGKTGRGHYHAILFGHGPEVVGHCDSLSELWTHGFCYDGTVTKDSIGYVAGYVFKENYREGKVPFVRMSLKPGIGMQSLRQLARNAAPYRLTMWPTNYTINGKRYPLCDGGLAAWQDEYLESGGLPPTISNPIARDLRARSRVLERGSRLSEEASVSFALARRYDDASALKKER